MRPRRCPVCGREVRFEGELTKTYPFCSKRCRLIDLGEWLSERYRISEDLPGAEIEESDESTQALP